MNKKLFKGALVLFASILMAVSCSAGDKTGGDANGGGSTGGTSKEKIVIKSFEDDIAKMVQTDIKKSGTGAVNITLATDLRSIDNGNKDIELNGTTSGDKVSIGEVATKVQNIFNLASDSSITYTVTKDASSTAEANGNGYVLLLVTLTPKTPKTHEFDTTSFQTPKFKTSTKDSVTFTIKLTKGSSNFAWEA